ncbi:MAG: hypothetical protein ACHQ1H_05170 [Nitrososphaerales archaeon]
MSQNIQRRIRQKENEGLPWELTKEILRAQVEQNLSWDGACRHVAGLVDKVKLDELVEKKAESLGKSRFFKSMNAARNKIASDAAVGAAEQVRKNECNFHTPCMKCGEPLLFNSHMSNYHSTIEPKLLEAFRNFYHETCPE